MSVIAALSSAAILALSTPDAAAQDLATEGPVTELNSIIVEGRRIEEAARAFIDEVGEPPRGTRLARWNTPVCISVTNMQPRLGQFVIDRIAMAALDAGADVGGPGCKPNVIILATSDGPALAQRLVKEVGIGFRPAINHTDLGRNALDDFQHSEAPIRWWNVTMPVTVDTGDPAITQRGDPTTFVTVRDGSRLRSNIRYDMAWTIVIVDMSRTGGAPLGPLADYVGMVSLAQIDADADLSSQSTIMNLFKGLQSVNGLTDWDKDYLSALYAAPADRANSRQQGAGVARVLVQKRRDRAGRDEAQPAPD